MEQERIAKVLEEMRETLAKEYREAFNEDLPQLYEFGTKDYIRLYSLALKRGSAITREEIDKEADKIIENTPNDVLY
ncbi:MAG: hypothetical protein PHF91_02045 [Bacilli bacterium]|nr:hypothetical protein [Bacilli bacterium]